jgi:uncharacterized protein (DUF3084 family)
MADNKEVKFTDEEMQSLADVQTSYQNIQMRMGNLAMQKIAHDKQEVALGDLEDTLLSELETLQSNEQALAQTFNEKYGVGQLDPATGVFTPQPKVDAVDESVPATESKA